MQFSKVESNPNCLSAAAASPEASNHTNLQPLCSSRPFSAAAAAQLGEKGCSATVRQLAALQGNGAGAGLTLLRQLPSIHRFSPWPFLLLVVGWFQPPVPSQTDHQRGGISY